MSVEVIDKIADTLDTAAPAILGFIPGPAGPVVGVILPLVTTAIRLIADAIGNRKTPEVILREFTSALRDADDRAATRWERLHEIDAEIDKAP